MQINGNYVGSNTDTLPFLPEARNSAAAAAAGGLAAGIGVNSAEMATNPPGIGTQQRDIDLAHMAADVYETNSAPPAGWREATDADLAAIGLDQSDLSLPNGDFQARVYVAGSGANTDYVVAFRGTQSGGDWVQNGRQGLGFDSPYYEQAINIGRKVALSGADAQFTGHSLGGGLASAASVASGLPGVTFNAAGLHGDTIAAATAVNPNDAPGEVTAYYVPGEILHKIQQDDTSFWNGIDWVGKAAPDAYGNQVALDVDRPSSTAWYNHYNSIDRHLMPWVIAGITPGNQ
ncbi:MAG: hypothetical protein WA979_02235 [Pacificimonas sp.]